MLRYPRGAGLGVDISEPLHTLPLGKSERLAEGTDLDIWAVGTMVETAREAAAELAKQGISAGVVNARFVKPLDQEALVKAAQRVPLLVTLEENALRGGFGAGVLDLLNRQQLLKRCQELNLGIPDVFVTHGKRDLLLRDLGLDVQGVTQTLTEAWANLRKEKEKQ